MNSDPVYSASLIGPRDYALDDLISLNDELVALVKSGVPLERGLLDFRGDLAGRLKSLASAVADRLGRGESLPQALASPELRLPPMYAALVAAGMRSGRLTAAMEELAATARRIAELRRLVTMSLLYPLVIIWVACGVVTALAAKWVFALLRTYELMHIEPSSLSESVMHFVAITAPYFHWLPLVFAVMIFCWWWAVGRAASAQPTATARWFRWLPGLRPLLRSSSAATFCEILALLLDHGEPLPQALALAGETSGDPQLTREAKLLGERIARGERIPPGDRAHRRIPALLRWLLAGERPAREQIDAIRAAGENYRQRSLLVAEWMSIYVPILLVVAIGGAAVTLFTVSVLGPWSTLLQGIGDGIGRGPR